MARRRPTYSAEFKAEALRRVRNTDASLVSIATELGMHATTLKSWLDASRPNGDLPMTGDERVEIRRLRKRVRELEMEREVLKKATAFFAKYSE